MHSALYRGWISHHRVSPTRNRFRYRLYMAWIDLAELPSLFDGYWLWSARRPALAWFRRKDYLGPHDVGLDVAVRDGRIKRGQLLLLETFGGGFTWGSALVRY